MKYLIAREVVYDTETATLTVNGSDSLDSQKLTNIANRILTILVATPGRVIERSELLDKVWGAVGHPGSSTSLNQYVSMLRKSLTSFTGVQETIISVPKVGFLFNPEIDVEPLMSTDNIATEEPPPKKKDLTRLISF